MERDQGQREEAGKPRKRPAGKLAERPGDGDVKKLKCTFHLSPDASRRVTVHGAYLGMDRSEMVEKLINDGLRRFVVSDRARSVVEALPEAG